MSVSRQQSPKVEMSTPAPSDSHHVEVDLAALSAVVNGGVHITSEPRQTSTRRPSDYIEQVDRQRDLDLVASYLDVILGAGARSTVRDSNYDTVGSRSMSPATRS